MSLEERWFRKVSEDFLVMSRMISAYRSMLKTHQQLLNKSKSLSDLEREALKPAIIAVEKQMEELAKQIADEAGRRIPAYNRVAKELGIDGNVNAMEALAEFMVYVDFANSPLRH